MHARPAREKGETCIMSVDTDTVCTHVYCHFQLGVFKNSSTTVYSRTVEQQIMMNYLARPAVLFILLTLFALSVVFISTPDYSAQVETRLYLQVPHSTQNFYHYLSTEIHRILNNSNDAITSFDEDMLDRRHANLRRACSQMEDRTWPEAELIYSNASNLLYCGVPKAGSKFLARLVKVLDGDKFISPYQFGHTRLVWKYTPEEKEYIKTFSKTAFKFVFGRDPYKRIFSSYVDKLLKPNPYYWRFGSLIISQNRKVYNKTKECGYDVTFRELVNFLVNSDLKGYDRHFRPVSALCDMCNTKYDVIGKVETMKHDVMYILNQSKTSERDVVFKDFKQENNIHHIVFNVRRVFVEKSMMSKCLSDHTVFLRLWRAFQIGGLIDKLDTYPLTPGESYLANESTIINLLLDAYFRSSRSSSSNSKEAMLQAYGTVSLDTLERLRDKYMDDFNLFDYESRPDSLFKDNNPNVDFDYYDVLKLR